MLSRENMLRSHVAAKNRFLHGLDCVPDDRLTWSPGGEAGSPLAIADKLAGFLVFCDAYFRTQAFPSRDGGPPPSATREEAKARITAAFDQFAALIREADDELLDKPIMSPAQHMTTVRQMLLFAPTITGYFQGQMNYCQLCYGDTSPNVPPNWGQEEI